jgi:hypothetical protein
MVDHTEPHFLSEEAIDIGRVVAHACFADKGVEGKIRLTEEELAEACAMTVDEVAKAASRRYAQVRVRALMLGMIVGGSAVAALGVLLWTTLT